MAKVGDLKMRLIIGESSAMRPCMVGRGGEFQKAFFHCWVDAETYSGVKKKEALVEYETGAVHQVDSDMIWLLDTKALMEQYHFGDNDVTIPVKLE